jgi:hypothetical protein
MQPGAESPAALPLAAGDVSTVIAAAAAVVIQASATLTGGAGSGVGTIDPTIVDHMRIQVGFSNFNVAVSGPIKVTVN